MNYGTKQGRERMKRETLKEKSCRRTRRKGRNGLLGRIKAQPVNVLQYTQEKREEITSRSCVFLIHTFTLLLKSQNLYLCIEGVCQIWGKETVKASGMWMVLDNKPRARDGKLSVCVMSSAETEGNIHYSVPVQKSQLILAAGRSTVA